MFSTLLIAKPACMFGSCFAINGALNTNNHNDDAGKHMVYHNVCFDTLHITLVVLPFHDIFGPATNTRICFFTLHIMSMTYRCCYHVSHVTYLWSWRAIFFNECMNEIQKLFDNPLACCPLYDCKSTNAVPLSPYPCH